MLLATLVFAAAVLTLAMFHSRNAALGFPCALFWAIAGGQAYTLSTTTWDVYFILAFGCLLGMVTFCVLGAYGLREKRDTFADEEMEEGEGAYVDEKPKQSDKTWFEDDGVPDVDDDMRPIESRGDKRKRELHERTEARRKRRGGFS